MDIQNKRSKFCHQKHKMYVGSEEKCTFCMCLNYVVILKIDHIYEIFYESHMITTKGKPTVYEQKMKRRSFKQTTPGNHYFTNENRKILRKEKSKNKKARKQEYDISKYLPIDNYFKYKWMKFSNQ